MGYLFVLLIGNYTVSAFYLLALIYGSARLFAVPFQKNKFAFTFLVFLPILELIKSIISYTDLQNQTYISQPLVILITLIDSVAMLIWLKKYTESKNLVLPLLITAFFACIRNIILMLQIYIFSFGWFQSQPLLVFVFQIFSALPTCICIYIIGRFFSRFFNFQRMLNFPNLVCVSSSLFLIVDFYFSAINIEAIRGILFNIVPLYNSTFFLVLFLLFLFLIREIDRNHHLTYSKKLIEEQKRYVEHVETLYGDLQKLQHDHKNLLSGMYLQVKEKRLDDVEKYLATALSATDENLQTSLREQKQLANVKIVEIKSLLFTKILRAKELGVKLNLEVINPVTSLSMDIGDFLRVFGIALDNALEAAAKIDGQAVVDVLLIQEKSYVELMIKNPYVDPIDTEKIWEMGYSTKGENRGIGLATYKEILDNYSEVLRETKISDNQFVHSLVIPV